MIYDVAMMESHLTLSAHAVQQGSNSWYQHHHNFQQNSQVLPHIHGNDEVRVCKNTPPTLMDMMRLYFWEQSIPTEKKLYSVLSKLCRAANRNKQNTSKICFWGWADFCSISRMQDLISNYTYDKFHAFNQVHDFVRYQV